MLYKKQVAELCGLVLPAALTSLQVHSRYRQGSNAKWHSQSPVGSTSSSVLHKVVFVAEFRQVEDLGHCKHSHHHFPIDEELKNLNSKVF